ncbi:hypothetical protein HY36_14635 [Hyphomonas atlantica]|uniref:Uncharacterized protein n=1 Tax=Hyphomonas atlantica TaxID=1280948 RepID=A0A059E6I0_9PROT|nr:hypothetical protein HY36_14635 [Hyphomonas atlantica]
MKGALAVRRAEGKRLAALSWNIDRGPPIDWGNAMTIPPRMKPKRTKGDTI